MKILTPIVSAAQSFTDTQKTQVCANIGALTHDDLGTGSTTKSVAIETGVGQKEITFDLTAGKKTMRSFDLFVDVAINATGVFPRIEIISGGATLENFYLYVPAITTASALGRFKLGSFSNASSTLSEITVRIYYGEYLTDGGNFSVTMTEVQL